MPHLQFGTPLIASPRSDLSIATYASLDAVAEKWAAGTPEHSAARDLFAQGFLLIAIGHKGPGSWSSEPCTCAAIRAGFDPEPIPPGLHHVDCPVTNIAHELAYDSGDE